MPARFLPVPQTGLSLHFPENIADALALVNELFGDNLSIVDISGEVYGALLSAKREDATDSVLMENGTRKVVLLAGEFRTGIEFDSMDEAITFLKGIYFAFYKFASEGAVRGLFQSLEADYERGLEFSLDHVVKKWLAVRFKV